MPASQSRSRWPGDSVVLAVQPLAAASEPLARVAPGASFVVSS